MDAVGAWLRHEASWGLLTPERRKTLDLRRVRWGNVWAINLQWGGGQ